MIEKHENLVADNNNLFRKRFSNSITFSYKKMECLSNPHKNTPSILVVWNLRHFDYENS